MTLFISESCLHLCLKSTLMPILTILTILTIHAHQKEWASIGHQYKINKNHSYSHSIFEFFSSHSTQSNKDAVAGSEL